MRTEVQKLVCQEKQLPKLGIKYYYSLFRWDQEKAYKKVGQPSKKLTLKDNPSHPKIGWASHKHGYEYILFD